MMNNSDISYPTKAFATPMDFVDIQKGQYIKCLLPMEGESEVNMIVRAIDNGYANGPSAFVPVVIIGTEEKHEQMDTLRHKKATLKFSPIRKMILLDKTTLYAIDFDVFEITNQALHDHLWRGNW